MPMTTPCSLRGKARWESANALLISDLHLSPQSPLAMRAFCHLLATHAPRFDSLLILGDLFEVYAGDDALQHDAFTAQIARALQAASRHCRIGIMHGNRDFLIGQAFCDAAGAALLADPCVLAAPSSAAPSGFPNGQPAAVEPPLLLSHGDSWCTLDAAYQTKKLEIRSPQWQSQVLALPWPQRWALASSYREQSMAQRASAAGPKTAPTNASIYDVVPAAFAASCAQHGVARGLHGHTHAPAQHAARAAVGARAVLGDWQFDPCASHDAALALTHSAVVGVWAGGALALQRYDGLALHAVHAAQASNLAYPAYPSSSAPPAN